MQEGSEALHSTDNVEEEQSRGIEYSLSFTSSDKTADSHWEEHVHSAVDVKEAPSKVTEFISLSTSKGDSGWGDFKCSVPAKSQVKELFLPSKNGTDSECSDVDLDNDWVTGGNSDSDSDSSVKDLESQKQSKWLRPFFKALDDVAQTEHGKESTFFYCPACRGSGLGETDLYKGLKPLMAHSKTYTKRRVKLHKQFANILKEDLKKCGNVVRVEACNEKPIHRPWHLIEDQKLKDLLIVWPPMVLIRTTGVNLDMHQERVRMDTKQFPEVFKDHCPKRVRHAYNPGGHLLSLLVFLDSPVGYMHAKHLVKNFKRSGKGRKQWNEDVTSKVQPCCDVLIYACMAMEEDMMLFDTCDASKKKIAWSMKSYKEAVMQPLAEMREAKLDNSLLKAQLQEQQEHNRFLEKALSKLHKSLELTEEEACAVKEIASRP